MQSASESAKLCVRRWANCIAGTAIDDRGKAAVGFARECAKHIHVASYDSRKVRLLFDEQESSPDEPETLFQKLEQPILIEATTLSFAEILLFCQAARTLQMKTLSFLYNEPGDYNRPNAKQVMLRRAFELTDEVDHFTPIPGNLFFIRGSQSVQIVCLAGFEGQRLARLLEQTGIPPSKCSVVFGVPAFQPGWEMDAFANNVRILREGNLEQRVLFGGAENPQAAYEAISQVYKTLAPMERLVIAPIGTKPHGIGAALFACEHDDVAVVYDHPMRKGGRSRRTGTWHVFEVSF